MYQAVQIDCCQSSHNLRQTKDEKLKSCCCVFLKKVLDYGCFGAIYMVFVFQCISFGQQEKSVAAPSTTVPPSLHGSSVEEVGGASGIQQASGTMGQNQSSNHVQVRQAVLIQRVKWLSIILISRMLRGPNWRSLCTECHRMLRQLMRCTREKSH